MHQRYFFLMILIVFPALIQAQTPQVTSTSPDQNELDISISSDIMVTFDMAMNRSTINSNSFMVSGMLSGFSSGVITFNGPSTTATFNSNTDFFYGELVTVVLTTGIESSSGTPIDGYVWSFTVEAPSGAGTFNPITNYSLGTTYSGNIFAADYNNDGYADIATTSGGDIFSGGDYIFSVMLNDGNGGFNPEVNYYTGPTPDWIVASDVDLDGDLDLIVGKPEIFVLQWMVFFNAGNGTFPSSQTYDLSIEAHWGFASDFNDDGYPDLAVSSGGQSEITVMMNDQTGSFVSPVAYPTPLTTSSITGADFDNDGDVDLASRNTYSVTIFFNNGNGSFSNFSNYNMSGLSRAHQAADLNGDGFVDLISGNTSQIFILINDGNGGFPTEVSYPVGGSYNAFVSLEVSDFDGDGDIDVAAGFEGYSQSVVEIYANDGNGILSLPVSYSGNGGGGGMFATDFDNDGDPDIAVRDSRLIDPDHIFFYWNEGPLPCAYIVGDVNNSGSYNGLDVTYGVAYFKGGPDPICGPCDCQPNPTFWACGDVNGSCSYNGLDITFGVEFLKMNPNNPELIPCSDCPPN